MNFIVVDDDNYKRERICDYIKSVVGEDANITEYTCGREILLHFHNLRRNDDKDIICKNTMLFLDWNFPFYANERIERGEGEFVLSEIDRLGFNIPTVIVSSDKVEIDEYDFVIGSIEDNSSVYQKPNYEKLIPEDLHRKEPINNSLER